MLSFLSACLVLIPILLLGTSLGILGEDGSHTELAQTVYWVCSAVMLYILIKTKSTFDLGFVFVILLGPLALLSLGFYWLSLKVFPRTK